MAVVKVRRLVANPSRRSRAARKVRSKHRRRMTPAQVRFFGTKRQKAALKAKRRKAILGALVANPSRKKVRARKRRSIHRRRTQQQNPALLVTLGAVNPRRRKVVARKRRKKVAVRANPRRRRRNTTRMVVTAPRRRYSRRSNPRRRRIARRRNPQLFGTSMSGAAMTKTVVAGLVGMASAKFLPTLLPSGLVGGNVMRTVATGAAALVSQMIAKAVMKDRAIADAVLFGGLMQTGSVGLNAFVPGLASKFGLSGLGDIVDANWSIPENPLRQLPVAVPSANARVGVGGLNRAFGSSF